MSISCSGSGSLTIDTKHVEACHIQLVQMHIYDSAC